MAALPIEWTADMLDDVPDDGRRWEVIDGQLLVTPAPNDIHQAVATEFIGRLFNYVQRSPNVRVMASPSDVRRGPRTRMQPDVFVYALKDGRRPSYPFSLSDLQLVIEVVSPDSRRADNHERRREYMNAGVPVYWIVDPDARHVERWAVDDERPEVISESIEWQAPEFDHPLVISLPELFAAALID